MMQLFVKWRNCPKRCSTWRASRARTQARPRCFRRPRGRLPHTSWPSSWLWL